MEEKPIIMKIRFHDHVLPHRDPGLHLPNAETQGRPPDISDSHQGPELTRDLHLVRSMSETMKIL